MKKTLKTILCAALALAIAAVLPASSFAGQKLDVPTEYDQQMLTAFWHQEAYDGLSNGEAVYDVHVPEGGYISEDPGEYEGGYYTRLISVLSENDDVGFLSMHFEYSVMGWDGTPYDGGDEEPMMCLTIRPDLYGELDLHGTSLAYMSSPEAGQTHITKVNLDDCTCLGSVRFNEQPFCTEISALGSNSLWRFSALNGAFRKIDFKPSRYSDALNLSAFGNGSIGAFYLSPENPEETTLSAYPKADAVVGWFEDGELVSTELEYVRTEGGSLVAVFGGDADGDGAVTVADAVLTMRASMGIIQAANSGMLDVDGSEDIDIADALLIMRFAMGLIG